MANSRSDKLFEYHNALLRDPAEIVAQNQTSITIRPELLQFKTQGNFWNVLHYLGIRLIVTREYEHFVCSLGASSKNPEISYLPLPHPSGIAVDRKRKRIFIAASRNPNQVYTFAPIDGLLDRRDRKMDKKFSRYAKGLLFPIKTNFYPGSLYIHDLALIGGELYANAVGHNAVVKLPENGGYEYAWWPRCADRKGRPDNQCNYFQLNSISGGRRITDCFFTASTDQMTSLRIGHPDFQVDGKGVVFSGKTRKPICHGLTRPHSARSHKGKIWLDNSGYGEFGFVRKDRFEAVAKLPGWTRGLCLYKDIAFVGVSRLLPRFQRYAPGLDTQKCVCGIFIVDLKSGKILSSMVWPSGNQIFSVEWIDAGSVSGFPNIFSPQKIKFNSSDLFYSYHPGGRGQ